MPGLAAPLELYDSDVNQSDLVSALERGNRDFPEDLKMIHRVFLSSTFSDLQDYRIVKRFRVLFASLAQ